MNHEQICQKEEITIRHRYRNVDGREITASNIGSVAKMKASTKTAKKFKQLLYSRITGRKLQNMVALWKK